MNKIIKNGKILINVKYEPAINNFQVNPDKMANNKCPAVKFAASRTPNDTAFIQCDINSIIIKNGANPIGLPAGKNIEKKSALCFTIPIIVTAKNIVKLNPNVTAICAVGVNVYGIIPIKFIIPININNVNISGKYAAPSLPIVSLTILWINSNIISNTDCHLSGIILPLAKFI